MLSLSWARDSRTSGGHAPPVNVSIDPRKAYGAGTRSRPYTSAASGLSGNHPSGISMRRAYEVMLWAQQHAAAGTRNELSTVQAPALVESLHDHPAGARGAARAGP